MPICNRCELTKSDTEFRLRSSGYRDKICLDCQHARQRQSQAQQSIEKRERKLQRMRLANKLRQYGLTPEQYQAMFDDRNGRCDICQQPETRMRNGKVLPLCVDHDAKTGRVRGLLCSNHNVGIGHFNHDIGLLEEAIRYLKEGGYHRKV